MNKLIGFITALLVVSFAVPSFAWNARAHKIIASIVFRRLDAETRMDIAARLRKHPRWEEDFESKMPKEVKNGTEEVQAEWIFQQASVWADLARGFPETEKKKYHMSQWHYVNQPIYLSPGDQRALGRLKLNLEIKPPVESSYRMNAPQVIEFTKQRLIGKRAKGVTPENDALMLCWLLHCYTDLHQPFHSTALFSRKLLKKGCRGGNVIKTKQSRNLHSLWDGLLGKDQSFRSCRNEAIKMLVNESLKKSGLKAAKKTSTKDVWKESHKLCISKGYTQEILLHLRRLEAAGATQIPELTLSDPYLKAAGNAARNQVNNAGYRLAEILGGTMSDEQEISRRILEMIEAIESKSDRTMEVFIPPSIIKLVPKEEIPDFRKAVKFEAAQLLDALKAIRNVKPIIDGNIAVSKIPPPIKVLGSSTAYWEKTEEGKWFISGGQPPK